MCGIVPAEPLLELLLPFRCLQDGGELGGGDKSLLVWELELCLSFEERLLQGSPPWVPVVSPLKRREMIKGNALASSTSGENSNQPFVSGG